MLCSVEHGCWRSVDDMLWVAVDDMCNDIFQALTRTISYFGFTIGDHSAATIVCDPMIKPELQRYAANRVWDAIGFRVFLTLPDVTFNLCCWKYNDLMDSLQKVVDICPTCSGKANRGQTSHGSITLQTVYKIVGRFTWVRVNSHTYIPTMGALCHALKQMVNNKTNTWTVKHKSMIWYECRGLLRFLHDKWLLVTPELIVPCLQIAAYTDAQFADTGIRSPMTVIRHIQLLSRLS